MNFLDFICLCVDILGVSFSQLRAISLKNVYTYLLSFCANLINAGGGEKKLKK